VADIGWVVLGLIGIAGIVWGAETFAEHLGGAAVALGVSSFALALLLAGAEPEELATAVAASLRHAPAVAFGDVIGANIAMCLVALGTGAVIAPLPFGRRVRLYGMLGLPVGATCAALAWKGSIGRLGGLALVLLYVVYVALIWRVEGSLPVLGEAAEIDELRQHQRSGTDGRRRVGKDLGFILLGVVAMCAGATLLVEGIRHIAGVDSSQTQVSLTIVGFATAFELVVLAVSASRRGATEVVVAAVVGSFAYNATMTLGAAALARPLRITGADRLHAPLLIMLGALALAIAIGSLRGRIGRAGGLVLLACYPVFIAVVLLHG
jgi:cation:H+ antiporter